MKSASIFFLSILLLSAVVTTFGQNRPRVWAFRQGDQGRLGVRVEDLTPRLKEKKKISIDQGAYVSEVVEDSPAEKAGIEEGDVIVKFGDRSIDDAGDLIRAVGRAKSNEEVSIQLHRKGSSKNVTAKLERRPGFYSYRFGDDDDNTDFDFDMDFDIEPPGTPHAPFAPRHPFHFRMLTTRAVGGLELQKLNKQLAQYFEVPDGRGLLVTEVEDGSEGEKAGFRAGDVITKVNGSTVRDLDDVVEEMRESEQTEVPIDLYRKGKPMTLRLTKSEDDDYSALPDGSFRIYSDKDGKHVEGSVTGMASLKRALSELKENIRHQLQGLREKLRHQFRSI